MGRYKVDEPELKEDVRITDEDILRFPKSGTEQPKRSPIRRKSKMQREEGIKPKAKRNYKKIQHRLKYDWQGE